MVGFVANGLNVRLSGTQRVCTQRPRLSVARMAVEQPPVTLGDKVRRYYELWNAREFEPIFEMLSDDIQIRDYSFPGPISGKDEVLKFMEDNAAALPGAQIILDDMTDGTTGDVAVKFHIENADGKEFPFTRGIGFYEPDDDDNILRESLFLELFKPGESAIPALGGLFSLLDKLPDGTLKNLPFEV